MPFGSGAHHVGPSPDQDRFGWGRVGRKYYRARGRYAVNARNVQMRSPSRPCVALRHHACESEEGSTSRSSLLGKLFCQPVNGLFRFLLAIWTIGFLVISCVPLLTGNAVAGGAGLLAGAVLLVPWLVGVLILSIFTWLTNPRR